MELNLNSEVEIKIGDGCSYTLPGHVTPLCENEIRSARRSEKRSNIIIAAGTDPKDHKVTVITADGRVLIFDAPTFHIPNGPSLPTHGGTKIFFPNVENRWAVDTPGFFAESEWIIKKCGSALTGASLHTNYKNEDNTTKVQTDSQGRG